ncbi:MAG: phosphoheptose isomerase [Acidimicrobiaceae bacterium]|nr:phosphoheptose isomerase [Acidimicrobiaceae bacterium]
MLSKKILEHSTAIQDLVNIKKNIDSSINKIFKSLKAGKKILICGNGGSAADAQHLTAEFLIRLNPKINRKPISIVNLVSDTSTITACSNDYSFDILFSRNLEALGKSGDILIIISTSGNSKNIINAIKAAKKKKIFSIGFLGNQGGKCRNIVDLPLIVNSSNTGIIQECHIFLGHYIFNSVEKSLLSPLRR